LFQTFHSGTDALFRSGIQSSECLAIIRIPFQWVTCLRIGIGRDHRGRYRSRKWRSCLDADPDADPDAEHVYIRTPSTPYSVGRIRYAQREHSYGNCYNYKKGTIGYYFRFFPNLVGEEGPGLACLRHGFKGSRVTRLSCPPWACPRWACRIRRRNQVQRVEGWTLCDLTGSSGKYLPALPELSTTIREM